MSSDSPVPSRHFTLRLNESTLALAGTAILLFSAAVWCARGPNAEKTDFSLTYVGGQIVHAGLGHSLYDIALQKQVRDSLFQHPSPLLFEHPPFEALLLSPLAAFPFRTAYLIFALSNAAVCLLLIFFLRPHLPWPQEDLGYLSLWLLFAPLGIALYQGQSSLLLLALYAVTFVCLKHRREFPAGLALGFGLFKFQFVFPFALMFLFRKRWQFLCGFVSSALFLGLLSLITVGGRGMTGYVRFVLTIGSNPQNESYGSAVDMPTLYGLMYAILGRSISHGSLNASVALSSMLLLGLVAWRWNSIRATSSLDLMFAGAVAASVVTGSHMFTQDFSPLILPMFLVAAQLSRQNIPLSPRSAMWGVLALFWAFPIYFLFIAWHCLYLMCPVLLIFVYMAIRGAGYLDRHQQSLPHVAAVR